MARFGRFKPFPRGTSVDMRRLTKSDRLLGFIGLLALVAGAVVLLVAHGTAAVTAGAVLLGLAGIAFVSLAFLIVGEGEDRDRHDGAL
jgi:hypothetical protein